MSASPELRGALLGAGLLACATSPALALDLNSFRAAHKLPRLSYSATLAGAAYGHAHDLAKRNRLDHNGFKERARLSGGTAAENVSWGCDDEDCATHHLSDLRKEETRNPRGRSQRRIVGSAGFSTRCQRDVSLGPRPGA